LVCSCDKPFEEKRADQPRFWDVRKKRRRILIVERKISVLKVDAAHCGDIANETQDDYNVSIIREEDA
jgi:hypothetical protein